MPSAVTAGGGLAALGVLFIPSTGPRGKWIEVGGRGDISYYQNPDEATIRVKYTTPDGMPHVFAASPGPGGNYRGPDGRVFARIVKNGVKAGILISTAELVGSDTDEPRACPAPVKDNGGELGRAYEGYGKSLYNPAHPTPSGLAYEYWSPSAHRWVKIDDCLQATGKDLAEYRGPNYEEHFVKDDGPWQGMWSGMKNQAKVDAKGDRSLTWYFEEKPMADYVREQFKAPYPGIVVK